MIDVKDLSKNLDEILNYRPSDVPVISLYLGVDAGRITKQEYTTVLNSLITSKRAEMEASSAYQASQKKSIHEMMEAIKVYVNDYFRPESARTLLVFAKEGKIFSPGKVAF